jgi:hypothetical protein
MPSNILWINQVTKKYHITLVLRFLGTKYKAGRLQKIT